VIDANALMQDPLCEGAVWQVLAHAPASWDLQLVTSEVAVAEAVAGFGRAVAEAVRAFDKSSRSWGRLGATGEADRVRQDLLAKVPVYEAHLRESLVDVGVDILPLPSVPHSLLVERAVRRRRPCDEHGNGYRDTLVWLSVVDLASASDEAAVVLITQDSDFMDADKGGLHEDLLQDLDAVGARDRVSLRPTLADVILELAEGAADEGDVKALRSELRDETVRLFVISLIEGVLGTQVDARACALPPSTTDASFEALGRVVGLTYSVRGSAVASGQAVADFALEVEAKIAATTPTGVIISDDAEAQMIGQSAEQSLFLINKVLVVEGLLQLGRYDRPLAGQITRIRARDDDPGRRSWNRQSLSPSLSELLKNLQNNPLQDALKNLQTNPLQDALKNLQTNPLQDALKNLQTNPLQDALKNLQTNPLQDLLRQLKTDPFRARQDDAPPKASGGDKAVGGGRGDSQAGDAPQRPEEEPLDEEAPDGDGSGSPDDDSSTGS
jgi:hypothetical protein